MTGVEELKRTADEIERELKKCEEDNRRIGSLTIKVQSFNNALRREDQTAPQIKQLQVRSRYFMTQARLLSERSAREQEQMEEEMVGSGIKGQRTGELEVGHKGDSNMTDSEFFEEQSGRMDNIIASTMDSIESLKRQGLIINRANDRLRDGLARMGMSGELIEKIEKRFGRDKGLFYALLILVVLLVLLLRFLF